MEKNRMGKDDRKSDKEDGGLGLLLPVDDEEQSERFSQAARTLDFDEAGGAFEHTIDKIAHLAKQTKTEQV